MRLDRTLFGRLREQAADSGRYRCPHCGADAEIAAAGFERAFGSARSALDPRWAARFDAARPLGADEREAFLDFACHGCGAPVRIVYRASRGWALGCLDWEAVDVLEAQTWQRV